MNADDYEAYLSAARERVRMNVGWDARCVQCWLRNRMQGVDTPDAPILKIRFSVIGGGVDGDMPHEDIHLKCPACQYHETHGWGVTASELERVRDVTGEDGFPVRFNAVRDAPESVVKERMRALGYL